VRGVIQSRVGIALVSVLTVAVILGGIAIGQMISSARLMSSGLVKSVELGVYKDSNCSEVMSSVGWGIVEPGSQHNASVYIRNEGNTEITLFLNCTGWNPPEAETYMVLSWNYTGQLVMPNQVILVILTLSVGNDAPSGRDFTFDVVITAMG